MWAREHHAGVSSTHKLPARVVDHLPGEDADVFAGYGGEAALQYRTNTSLHDAVSIDFADLISSHYDAEMRLLC